MHSAHVWSSAGTAVHVGLTDRVWDMAGVVAMTEQAQNGRDGSDGLMTDRYKSRLHKLIRRSRLKVLLRIGGIALAIVGMTLLPANDNDREPARRAPIFGHIKRVAGFTDYAIILIGVRTVAFAASWLVRGDAFD